MVSSTTKPLPPLTPSEFREFNSLSVHMDHFHNHFRRQWNLLWSACESNRRPGGMSIRQFLATGQQFCQQLEMHHGYEEALMFPVLGERMPEFAVSDKGKGGKGKGKGGGKKGKGGGKGKKGGGGGGGSKKCDEEERRKVVAQQEEVDASSSPGGAGDAATAAEVPEDQDKKPEPSKAETEPETEEAEEEEADPDAPLWGDSHHINQHRQIHAGLEGFAEYLRAVRSGETELELAVMKTKMSGWGTVLWEHLDQEVKTLGAENMRRYWTLEEMRRLPWR